MFGRPHRPLTAILFVPAVWAAFPGNLSAASQSPRPGQNQAESHSPMVRRTQPDWHSLSSALWSGMNGVASLGSQIYCAMDAGLQVVTEPKYGGLRIASRLPLTSSAQFVRVFERELFVVDKQNTLWRFDLTRTDRPKLVSNFQLGDLTLRIQELQWKDSLLVMAAFDSGVYFINLRSEPGTPFVGHYAPGRFLWDIALLDSLLIATTDSNRVEVINVADPSRPTKIATIKSPYPVQAVTICDHWAFVYESADFLLSAVAVYDLTRPAEPSLMTRTFTYDYSSDLACMGDKLVVTHFDDVLYGGMSIYRIDSVGGLTRLSGYFDRGIFGRVVPFDGQALIPYGEWESISGFRLFEIPSARVAAHYGPLIEVGDVISQQEYAFVASERSGAITVDISDVNCPIEVSRVKVPTLNTFVTGGIALGDGLLYLGTTRGLYVFDVSDPIRPRWLGSEGGDVYDHVYHIALNGDVLYAASSTGIRVMDISNPSSPVPIRTTGYARRLSLWDHVLWAVGEDIGLVGYDVSTPEGPTEIARYNKAGKSRDVASEAGFVYYTEDTGVLALDVSDPTAPIRVSSIETGHQVRGLYVEGGTLLVALGEDGVSAYDVRDHARPTLIESFDTPGYAENVRAHGGAVLVADRSSLQIIGPEVTFKRGDASGDGKISAADALYLANYLYGRGPSPQPTRAAGDADCDEWVTLLDVVSIVNHVMRGGPAPGCPDSR